MPMYLNSTKISIFPDNFAFYRIPVFQKIGNLPQVNLTVYSPFSKESPDSVKSAVSLSENQTNNSFHIKPTRHLYFGIFRMWTQGLLTLLLRKEYDLVICWGEVYNISTWLALFLANLTNQKIVLWTHGMYGNEKWLKRKSRVIFYNLANALLLYGNKSKHILEKEGLHPEKMFVIYNSLNYENQKELRNFIQENEIKKVHINLFGKYSDKIKILLFVGRLKRDRKLDVALRALKKLNKKKNIYRLVVIGEGPKKKEYESLTCQLGITQAVNFIGEIYNENELAPYFLSADLGVFPGSVGLFAVHAHAYGLPVCTHDSSITKQNIINNLMKYPY